MFKRFMFTSAVCMGAVVLLACFIAGMLWVANYAIAIFK